MRQEAQYAFCVLAPAYKLSAEEYTRHNPVPIALKQTILYGTDTKSIVEPNSQTKCESAISWLNAETSAFHLARWLMDLNIFSSDVLSRELDVFRNAPEYLLHFDNDRASNDGPGTIREWCRAKVSFFLQVLLFVHASILKFKRDESSNENLALKTIVENLGFVKLPVNSFVHLDLFEAEAQQERYLSSSTVELLKQLQLLIQDKARDSPTYLKTLYTKVRVELTLGLKTDSDVDLGYTDLTSASGCAKAVCLATGYRKLLNINILRDVLPEKNMLSGEKLILVVYGLGKAAGPREKAVGTEILKLAFCLGISAYRMLDIILRSDDEVELDEFSLTSSPHPQNTQGAVSIASTQRRREKRIAREQEKG